MSQYDIIFFNSLATQNLLWQPPNPTYPTSESSSIQDVQTQGSGLGKSLYQSDMPQTICTTTCPACSRQRLSQRGTDLGAVDTQPSSPLPASPLPELSAQAWVDWFPELFPQRNWIIYDKREWDARILWEMAQSGYPTHTGRAFGGNTLGWNFQVTKASYDVMPLHTNNYLQNGRLFPSVGYWNPEKEAITFNGWNYKAPIQYPTVPALVATAPEGFVEVLVPHSLVLTPRSSYDGNDIWSWVKDWLDFSSPEDEASMDEAPVVEVSEEGSRKRKRED